MKAKENPKEIGSSPVSMWPPQQRKKPWPRGWEWRVGDVARYLGVSYRHARLLMTLGYIRCKDVSVKGKTKSSLRTSLRHIKAYLDKDAIELEEPASGPRQGKHIDFSKSGRG